MRRQALNLTAAAAVAALAGGCPDNPLAPIEPCTVAGLNQEIQVNTVDNVDVLFVIDNSQSMEQEQANLAKQLPNLVKVLAKGDRTPDDPADDDQPGVTFPPVASLHLGVVSTDMGTNGVNRQQCEGMGDDGVLLSRGATTPPNGVTLTCRDSYPSYLTFIAGETDPEQLGDDFACISLLGINGCGFEQQLEAALKAVARSDQTIDLGGGPEPLRFSGMTTGHGDGANQGFIREDSIIAVIVVTDEDDCSIPDESRELFSGADDGRYSDEPTNLRCAIHDNDGTMHPIERYVRGLRGLRPGHPEQVIFAAITGIPPELDDQVAAGSLSLENVLKDPSMQYQPDGDPTTPEPDGDPTGDRAEPVPSCITGNGKAYPPRRLVRVAAQFNSGELQNGVVRSICKNDFSSALDSIIEKIAEQLKGACLDRVLIADDKGLVQCNIVEVLSDADSKQPDPCSAVPGRRFQGMGEGEEKGRVVCVIDQVAVLNGAAGDGQGWYYDDFSEQTLKDCGKRDSAGQLIARSGRKIAFTEGAEPLSGSTIRFDCEPPVFASDTSVIGKAAAGVPCPSEAKPFGAATSCSDLDDPTNEHFMYCVGAFQTCQIACNNNSNCPRPWVCDFSRGDIVPDDESNPSTVGDQGYCANPTCPAIRE